MQLRGGAIGAVFLAAALAAGAAACASIVGIKDLSDAGAPDAGATQGDEVTLPLESGSDGDADATVPTGTDANDEVQVREGGEEDAARDGAADAGIEDAAPLTDAMVACLAVCTDGCCDGDGGCQKGTTVGACGKGVVCQACTQVVNCPLAAIGYCCGGAQTCTCTPKAACF